MSIDWDKRQGRLGRHKHLFSDIVSEDTSAPLTGDEGDVLKIVGGNQAFTAPTGVVVLSTTVTLTNAQIKALGAGTAVTIVPPPGVGKAFNFVSGFVVLNTTAGVYTNVNVAAYFQFTLEGFWASVGMVGNPMNLMLTGGGVYGAFFAPASSGTVAAGSNTVSEVNSVADYIDNYALQLSGGNGGAGAFTGGNAANTLKITVLYMIIDV